MQTIEYTVTDPLGIHARPAGMLVKQCATYESRVSIKKADSGKVADAKRIMGIMTLGVKEGDPLIITIEGEDEEKAKAEIESFLNENL